MIYIHNMEDGFTLEAPTTGMLPHLKKSDGWTRELVEEVRRILERRLQSVYDKGYEYGYSDGRGDQRRCS